MSSFFPLHFWWETHEYVPQNHILSHKTCMHLVFQVLKAEFVSVATATSTLCHSPETKWMMDPVLLNLASNEGRSEIADIWKEQNLQTENLWMRSNWCFVNDGRLSYIFGWQNNNNNRLDVIELLTDESHRAFLPNQMMQKCFRGCVCCSAGSLPQLQLTLMEVGGSLTFDPPPILSLIHH